MFIGWNFMCTIEQLNIIHSHLVERTECKTSVSNCRFKSNKFTMMHTNMYVICMTYFHVRYFIIVHLYQVKLIFICLCLIYRLSNSWYMLYHALNNLGVLSQFKLARQDIILGRYSSLFLKLSTPFVFELLREFF